MTSLPYKHAAEILAHRRGMQHALELLFREMAQTLSDAWADGVSEETFERMASMMVNLAYSPAEIDQCLLTDMRESGGVWSADRQLAEISRAVERARGVRPADNTAA